MAKLLFYKEVTKKAAHAQVVKEHKKRRLVLKVSLAANGIMAVALVAIGVYLWLM